MATDDGAAAFKAAAQALNDQGDKELRKNVYGAFRKAAKPLAESVIREGAREMPKRGGLSAKVAGSKSGQSNSTTGRNPGVTLTFRGVKDVEGKNMDLKTLDVGIARHPTFGRRGLGQWKVTNVPKGAFTRPFEAGLEPVKRELFRVLEDAAADIARKTKGH